jgi:hypothetical protein
VFSKSAGVSQIPYPTFKLELNYPQAYAIFAGHEKEIVNCNIIRLQWLK